MNRKDRDERRQKIYDLLTKAHPEWKITGMIYTEINESGKKEKK